MASVFLNNFKGLDYLTPEILLSISAILLLLFELFSKDRALLLKTIIALAVLVFGLALVIVQPLQSSFTLFNGLVVVDGFANFFRFLFIIATGLTVLVAFKSTEIDPKDYGETIVFLLITVVFMSLLVMATNFLLIYLSLESLSLVSYILVANRRKSSKASEAGLKYAIYGGVASGVMLYGMSLLYGFSGSLDLTQIAAKLSLAPKPFLFVAVIMVLVGFGYKIAMVPFHMWAPDAYEGAATPITGFISVAPKAAGFAVLIRFLTGLTSWVSPLPFILLFFAFSVAAMTLGNLSAIHQRNVKRLLAYSSIAHVGYILTGLTITDFEGIKAIMVYLAIYVFMNLGAFAVVQFVTNVIKSEDIEAYKGLGRRFPLVGVIFSIFLFSLTGIPPFAGFIAKFFIISTFLKYSNSFYFTLALFAIINTVISLFYYTKIMKIMFMEEGAETQVATFPSYASTVLILLALPILFLGLYCTPLFNYIQYFLSH